MIDLSFWRAPERLFDEPDELVIWAQAALRSCAVGCREERTLNAKAKINGASMMAECADGIQPSMRKRAVTACHSSGTRRNKREEQYFGP